MNRWRMVKLLAALLTLALVRPTSRGAAQQAANGDVRVVNARLGFGEDGKFVHVVGESVADLAQNRHVRAITYDAATGAVAHAVNLAADTEVSSVTYDGRTAIVCAGCSLGASARMLLLDTETGSTRDIPSSWYSSENIESDTLISALSADGRLISFYSEDGPPETPMVVSVYDWGSKNLVAKRMSEYTAAGGAFGGGVTADGQIEFSGSRVGEKIVDLRTGNTVAWFGSDSVRSLNGELVVEFPNLSWNDSAPKEVIVRSGRTGLILHTLGVQVPEDEVYGQMTGAFCGATNRFVAASEREVAAYEISSGALIESFAANTWQDPVPSDSRPALACASDGKRVAILFGSRFTLHDVR